MACAAVFVYVFLRRKRRISAVGDVPGPVNPSWIFGMYRRKVYPAPCTSSCRSITLNVEALKDTSGIFKPKKLGEQRRGSLRASGISFVGTAHLEYVALLFDTL